jgi:hypothetical protein
MPTTAVLCCEQKRSCPIFFCVILCAPTPNLIQLHYARYVLV